MYSGPALATLAVDGVRESCTVRYLSAYKNDRASVWFLWTFVVNDAGFPKETGGTSGGLPHPSHPSTHVHSQTWASEYSSVGPPRP